MNPATLALAEQLLTQGLTFWLEFQQKKAAGTLTLEDVENAAAQTADSLAQFEAHVAANRHV